MKTLAAAPILLLLAACGTNPSSAGAGVATTTAPVVRTDIARTQSVSGTITYGAALPVIALGEPGVVTWLPAEGTVVNRGERLYGINGRPTLLFTGTVPAFRSMTIGTYGTDVEQLEQNVLALGFANSSNLIADGHFTSADAAAVRRWQRALGVAQTGVVDLGTVLFAPNPMRIAALQLTLGAQAGPGAVILTTSPTDVHVNVPLDTSYIAFVHATDPVRVTLPDLSTSVGGHIVSIAPNAIVASAPNQPSRPTIAVRVDVDDPTKLRAYDQAPVQVAITIQVHRNVLAVPVLALLAEPGETYAVRTVHGSTRTLVTVVPGLQASNGLIEVASPSLSEGELVEVPAQ